MILKSGSVLQTQKIASDLAKKVILKNGSIVITLNGELGVGKTTFAQGFARGLGIEERVISPTFVLIRQHQIPNSKKVFYHLDLYRMDEPIDIYALGLEELLGSESIILIEWAEKLKDMLGREVRRVSLRKTSENKRQIEIGD